MWRWPPPPPPPPAHQGFYLRLGLGPTAFKARFAPHENGAGAALDVAAGGTVGPGLVLFGELNAIGDGSARETSAFMIGGGVAYWLLEPNIYFSASVGAGAGAYRNSADDRVSTPPGSGHA